jgi:DNA-binding MarR family transcriptional regulator
MKIEAANVAVNIEGDADIPHRELLELSARFSHLFTRWLDAKSPGGLSYPRLRLLEVLHCQGPAKMKTLGDALGLSARNMTAVADSLESDGLLRRVAHPSDRRATLLELTDDGQAAADESLVPRLAEISRLFDELSPTARNDLRATLARLVGAMESGCGAEGGC